MTPKSSPRIDLWRAQYPAPSARWLVDAQARGRGHQSRPPCKLTGVGFPILREDCPGWPFPFAFASGRCALACPVTRRAAQNIPPQSPGSKGSNVYKGRQEGFASPYRGRTWPTCAQQEGQTLPGLVAPAGAFSDAGSVGEPAFDNVGLLQRSLQVGWAGGTFGHAAQACFTSLRLEACGSCRKLALLHL